jgi:hypothetical protein
MTSETAPSEEPQSIIKAIEEYFALLSKNEMFWGLGGLFVLISTGITGLALHGDSYVHGGGVDDAVARPAALLAELLVISMATALFVLHRTIRRRRGATIARLAFALVAVVALFFALLPPLVDSQTPLAVFLYVLLTLGIEGIAAGYLAVTRPWIYLREANRIEF